MLLPKTGMPWGADRAANTSRGIPASYSQANLAAGKKTTLPYDGKCQGCGASCPAASEPCWHSWKAQQEQHRQQLCGQQAGISAGIHSQFPAHALCSGSPASLPGGTDATGVARAQACFLSDPRGSSALGKESQIQRISDLFYPGR